MICPQCKSSDVEDNPNISRQGKSGFKCRSCGDIFTDHPDLHATRPKPTKLTPSNSGPSFALLEPAKPVINTEALAETHRQADAAPVKMKVGLVIKDSDG